MDTVRVKETLPARNPSPQAESDDIYKYDMDFPEKSLCLIINMENFSDPKLRRRGTDKDEESVENVFKEIGFEVKIAKDKKSGELFDIMVKVAKEDHSKRSCFVCVIMSHGEEGKFRCSDMEFFEDQRLFQLFNGENAKSLAGKPKMFFLQKCTGKKRDLGVTLHGPPKENGTKIPTEADFLYHYATYSGYVSYRNPGAPNSGSPKVGSWFMQSLCGQLKKHCKKEELLHILTRVNHEVAFEYETPDEEKKKQMPCVVSTLTKFLYL